MKSRLLFPTIACILLTSCSEERRSTNSESGPEVEAGFSFTSGQYDESAFSPWMSRAELQVFQQGLPKHQYFARVEGSDRRGRSEYRAAARDFPGGNYEEWAVFWGINEEKLFQLELMLIEKGFVRSEMQSFKNSSGETLNQIVWLRPIGGSSHSEDDAASITQNKATAPPIHEPAPDARQSPPAENQSLPDQTPTAVPSTLTELDIQPELPELVEQSELPSEQSSRVKKADTHAPIAEKRNEPDAEDLALGKLSGPGKTYVVRKGDTLGVIARRHGCSVATLKKTNRLKSDALRVGQKLNIPGAE